MWYFVWYIELNSYEINIKINQDKEILFIVFMLVWVL